MVIWKRVLAAVDEQTIEVPQGARFIHFREQHESPTIWFLCDPAAPLEKRQIMLHGTGHPIRHDGVYIGTAMLFGGGLVLHAFVVLAMMPLTVAQAIEDLRQAAGKSAQQDARRADYEDEDRAVTSLLSVIAADRAALVEALRRYGAHSGGCVTRFYTKPPQSCDCGLEAALAALPQPVGDK